MSEVAINGFIPIGTADTPNTDLHVENGTITDGNGNAVVIGETYTETERGRGKENAAVTHVADGTPTGNLQTDGNGNVAVAGHGPVTLVGNRRRVTTVSGTDRNQATLKTDANGDVFGTYTVSRLQTEFLIGGESQFDFADPAPFGALDTEFNRDNYSHTELSNTDNATHTTSSITDVGINQRDLTFFVSVIHSADDDVAYMATQVVNGPKIIDKKSTSSISGDVNLLGKAPADTSFIGGSVSITGAAHPDSGAFPDRFAHTETADGSSFASLGDVEIGIASEYTYDTTTQSSVTLFER